MKKSILFLGMLAIMNSSCSKKTDDPNYVGSLKNEIYFVSSKDDTNKIRIIEDGKMRIYGKFFDKKSKIPIDSLNQKKIYTELNANSVMDFPRKVEKKIKY